MPRPAPAFEDLPTRAQVHRLRQVAITALEQYPFEARSLRLLEHAFNTSFRIDTTDGRRFAMRINVNSRKSEANLAAEVAWLDALARDTDLAVPVPQRTRSGGLRTHVWFEPLGRELPVVVMSWLPGRDLDEPDHAAGGALGRITAALHDHAERWSPPASSEFPPLDDVLVDVPNGLLDDHPLVTPDRREVFAAALDQVQAHYDVIAATMPHHSIHADLHGGNVKWLRGRMSVFDFDDACHGAPLHDLAISMYYLRDEPGVEEAVLGGYVESRPLPVFTRDQFEAVVASRNLVLANDVLRMTTASIRAVVPTYLSNSAIKLQAYLDTGVYRHDVPGLTPIDI